MKANTPELMKFQRLQRRLKESRRGTIGLLEGLWIATAKNCPEGDIGKFSNEEIAIMVDWEGDPDELVEALVSSGWVDSSEDRRLVVHDWQDHCPTYVKGVAARSKKKAAIETPATSRTICEPDESSSELESSQSPTIVANYSSELNAPQLPTIVSNYELPTTYSSLFKPNQAKPNQAKREKQNSFAFPLSDELKEAWTKWKKHLDEIRTPLTSTSEECAMMELHRCFDSEVDRIAAIEFSILRRAKHLILNGDHRSVNESGKHTNFAGSKPSRRIPTFSDLGLTRNDRATS